MVRYIYMNNKQCMVIAELKKAIVNAWHTVEGNRVNQLKTKNTKMLQNYVQQCIRHRRLSLASPSEGILTF